MHKTTLHKTLVLGPLLALALAACGGSTGSAAPDTSSAGGGAPSATGSLLTPATTSLGKVLVDGDGRTVYLLTADSSGHSSCNDECLARWPAVAPGSATEHLDGISAPIGTAGVAGGGKTATVGGRPVYTYSQDSAPGDVKGQGVKSFGGVWYAVSPAGQPVKQGGSASPSSGGGYSQQGGGGGY